MTDNIEHSGNSADDMAEYLQTFLDETEEQLDDLVETMLALERDPNHQEDLNEAFRLIHSIKGSAGMMGFDNITVLTHHLENRFERFRSARARLDEPTMNLVLRCIDFLRQCNQRLRDGAQLSSSAELLGELKRLEEQADEVDRQQPEPAVSEPADPNKQIGDSPAGQLPDDPDASDTATRMVIRFRAGLQLADLKAQLIVARLSGLGEVKSTQPALDQLSEAEQLEGFEVRIETRADLDGLRSAADVDGVESIDFAGAAAEVADEVASEVAVEELIASESNDEAAIQSDQKEHPLPPEPASVPEASPTCELASADSEARGTDERDVVGQRPAEAVAGGGRTASEPSTSQPSTSQPLPAQPLPAPSPTAGSEPSAEKATAKVAETMRVDIDRLDNLMNLAGELVVNRARFVQISEQISPALRKASMLNRVRDFSDTLRRTIDSMEGSADHGGDWSAQVQQLRAGLELMEEQSEIWDNGRRCFSQMGEAIDQLSRVSNSLQRGVLDTRMVPVGPLFNRFKRVVRDLSKERGKKVNLVIRGENTELDKRMIDELGDPLVHLVRNSLDHGLEPPDVRIGHDKPEVGTIRLEASHSGNNVHILVRDDGGGIDVAKIKARLLHKQILSPSAVDHLPDAQALQYIWHPGFSTATEVTDVSGRGVGMDAVKMRINQLNGTVEIDSVPQRGTTFTIRLPLTLAIINSLLVRLRNVIFSMPIDDVREIVSVKQRDVVTVHGKQTFDVRGEYIPLVGIDDIFHWHGVDYGHHGPRHDRQADSNGESLQVVVLHSGGKTMGLRVDELLGSQDIVIKSLSDNFMHIRGLSGASILGDGSVCLMFDVVKVIDLGARPSPARETEEAAS